MGNHMTHSPTTVRMDLDKMISIGNHKNHTIILRCADFSCLSFLGKSSQNMFYVKIQIKFSHKAHVIKDEVYGW